MKEPWYVVHTRPTGSLIFLSAPFGSPAVRRWVTQFEDADPMTRRKAEKIAEAMHLSMKPRAQAVSHSDLVALVVCGE